MKIPYYKLTKIPRLIKHYPTLTKLFFSCLKEPRLKKTGISSARVLKGKSCT